MRWINDTQSVPKDSENSGLQVLAAGKWRCATSSLQLAFEKILQPSLAPSMHGSYIMPFVSRERLLARATLEPNKEARQKLLRQIFDGYKASSDWPGHQFADDLMDMYPNAKIILNKRRTPEEWEKSVRNTLAFFITKRYFALTCLIPICYHHHKTYLNYATLAKERYGVDDIFSKECYIRHNEWVRKQAAARGKEVLEWEPDDGWEPLCKFIGCDVPKEAFPRTNETAEIQRGKHLLVLMGVLAWVGLLGIIGGGVFGLVYFVQAVYAMNFMKL